MIEELLSKANEWVIPRRGSDVVIAARSAAVAVASFAASIGVAEAQPTDRWQFEATPQDDARARVVPRRRSREAGTAGVHAPGHWRGVTGDAPIDLVSGVRTNYLKLDLDLSASALAPQGRTIVKSRDWVDGFAGARVQYPLAPKWSAVGYADLRGGGSDFTW